MTDTTLPSTTRRAELEQPSARVRRTRPWPAVLLGIASVGAIVAAVLLIGYLPLRNG